MDSNMGITVIQLNIFPTQHVIFACKKSTTHLWNTNQFDGITTRKASRALGTRDDAAKEGVTNPLSLQILWKLSVQNRRETNLKKTSTLSEVMLIWISINPGGQKKRP